MLTWTQSVNQSGITALGRELGPLNPTTCLVPFGAREASCRERAMAIGLSDSCVLFWFLP